MKYIAAHTTQVNGMVRALRQLRLAFNYLKCPFNFREILSICFENRKIFDFAKSFKSWIFPQNWYKLRKKKQKQKIKR